MSAETVRVFLDKVAEDSALQAEVETMIQDKGEGQMVSTGDLVAAGSRHGFEFTAEELRDEIVRQRGETAGRELSEEEMEGVAGGMGRPEKDAKYDGISLGLGRHVKIFDVFR